jgi:hypothetical protein
MRAITVTCICALLLVACGGRGGAGGQAHPDGWREQTQGKTTAWVDPKDARQRYAVASTPNATGTLADLGAKITVDTLLRNRGAKLVRSAMPYPGCPGEAGLQTFSVPSGAHKQILHVAYTQWNGTTVTAGYMRPAEVSDDSAAVNALTRAVCSAVSGSPTLPPADP